MCIVFVLSRRWPRHWADPSSGPPCPSVVKKYVCGPKLIPLILQNFRHFTYVTTHSPTLPSPYQRHSSFSNPSVASPTSQLILEPFFRFSYISGSSLTSLGGPPMTRTWWIQHKHLDDVILVSFHTTSHSCVVLKSFRTTYTSCNRSVNFYFQILEKNWEVGTLPLVRSY